MTQAETIRVLLVDDHVVFRESLARHLDQYPDIEIVGEAPHAEACIREIDACRPEVVLMDIDMPGLSPFAAVSMITSRLRKIRVLFLSALSNDAMIRQAIDAKAWGYVTKSECTDAVYRAIRSVHAGHPYYSPEIRSRLVRGSRGVRLSDEMNTKTCLLTGRQLELLGYLARGMSTQEISELMCISPKTVENHKANLMKKLDIHDRVELARFAFREGISNP